MNQVKRFQKLSLSFLLILFAFSANANNSSTAIQIEIDPTLAEGEAILYSGENFTKNAASLSFGEVSDEVIHDSKVWTIRSIKLGRGVKVSINFASKKRDETIYASRRKVSISGYSSVTVAQLGTRTEKEDAPAETTTPPPPPPTNTGDEVYAVLHYDITKVSKKIRPGRYDHNALKNGGLRFVQRADVPAGYELIAYPLKGFRGKSKVITNSNPQKVLAMSVELRPIGGGSSTTTTTPSTDTPSEIRVPALDGFATLYYKIKKTQKNIRPGKYDHAQLKENGLTFIDKVDVSPGYELVVYKFKGFKGDPRIFTGKGNVIKPWGMSVELRKQ